jgi:hypothetical protein
VANVFVYDLNLKFLRMEMDLLQKEMLFACIWKEREEGGYNSVDFEPFVAMEKVNNQGVDAYKGYSLKEKRTSETEMTVVAGNEVYKPLSSFSDSGDERIFVSNDLTEICNKFLERWGF